MNKLKSLTEKELLIFNSKIMNELKARKVIRTKNNPIADYCEWLISQKYNWILQNSSNTGFDALDENGLRVQIKCRTLKDGHSTGQLGVIRKLNDDTFDYLIAILFDEDFEVRKAYKISKKILRKYSRFNEHQNGNILSLKGKILQDSELLDISEELH